MDFTWFAAFGVLVGIIVFALKISLGCGLASLSRGEIVAVAVVYLVLSLIMGVFMGFVPEDLLALVLDMGIAMHLLIAFLLVAVGVITSREWNRHGRDLSRKTFWILAMPCPACVAATFLSCSVLVGLLDVTPWKIGASVGLLFFTSIVVLSTTMDRVGKAPSTLGNVMIFVGLFYILSILVIPAYLSSQSTPFAPVTMPVSDLAVSYLFILALVSLGFVGRKWGLSL